MSASLATAPPATTPAPQPMVITQPIQPIPIEEKTIIFWNMGYNKSGLHFGNFVIPWWIVAIIAILLIYFIYNRFFKRQKTIIGSITKALPPIIAIPPTTTTTVNKFRSV